MKSVIGILFKENGKIYNFNNNIKVEVGENVIIDTEKGTQFGKVVQTDKSVDDKVDLKDIIRVADEKDLKKHEKNLEDAANALTKAETVSEKLKLNMRFTEASFNFDRTKLVFYFVSENRVDFRELAKELASIYKTRIELRQIGVRDKAKEVSGLGQCGRELCCSCFLNDLNSVSISMAKDQNLALNPTKINGQCGRLLCCLKYENDMYNELRDGMPNVGKKITTEAGEGRVISIDILNRSYTVEHDRSNREEIKMPEISGCDECEKRKNCNK